IPDAIENLLLEALSGVPFGSGIVKPPLLRFPPVPPVKPAGWASKLQSSPQLDDPGTALLPAEEAVVLGADHSHLVRHLDIGRRFGEVGVMEKVTAHRHQVKVPSFGQKEAFPNRQVDGVQSRPFQDVDATVPEPTGVG